MHTANWAQTHDLDDPGVVYGEGRFRELAAKFRALSSAESPAKAGNIDYTEALTWLYEEVVFHTESSVLAGKIRDEMRTHLNSSKAPE